MQMNTSVSEGVRRQITQLAQRNTSSVYISDSRDIKFDCEEISIVTHRAPPTNPLDIADRKVSYSTKDELFHDLLDALIRHKFTRVKKIQFVSFEFIVCTTVITHNVVEEGISRNI